MVLLPGCALIPKYDIDTDSIRSGTDHLLSIRNTVDTFAAGNSTLSVMAVVRPLMSDSNITEPIVGSTWPPTAFTRHCWPFYLSLSLLLTLGLGLMK